MSESSALPMIEAIGLSKFYRDFAAIRDVSFVDPAGPGCGLSRPQRRGQVHHHEDPDRLSRAERGHAPASPDWMSRVDRIRAAERLGYLPENGPLYPEMTPLGLLKFFGRARGLTGLA